MSSGNSVDTKEIISATECTGAKEDTVLKRELKHADFCQAGLLSDFILEMETGCISLPIYTTFMLEEEASVRLPRFLRDLAITLVFGVDIVIVVVWVDTLVGLGAMKRVKELLRGKVILGYSFAISKLY